MLDGESLVLLLKGQDALDNRALFWHFPAYLQACLPEQGHWRTTPAGAIRQGDWKLIEYFEDGRLELYNLEEDTGERKTWPKSGRRKRASCTGCSSSGADPPTLPSLPS